MNREGTMDGAISTEVPNGGHHMMQGVPDTAEGRLAGHNMLQLMINHSSHLLRTIILHTMHLKAPS